MCWYNYRCAFCCACLLPSRHPDFQGTRLQLWLCHLVLRAVLLPECRQMRLFFCRKLQGMKKKQAEKDAQVKLGAVIRDEEDITKPLKGQSANGSS